jgi:RES domain-containing protein
MTAAKQEWPRIAEVAFDDTHRLIPGQYDDHEESPLAALSDNDTDLRALVQLSGATDSRLQAQAERHPAGLGRDDLVFGIPYSKIINAAFAYPGDGARFHSPHGKGAWYCALDLETCVAEVVHKRVNHLAECGLNAESNISYRLFLADIHGQQFAWLDQDSSADRACLDPLSHASGQALGQQLSEDHTSGIVYPSVRYPGGTCIAVLAAPVVANVRRAAHYTITIENGALADLSY